MKKTNEAFKRLLTFTLTAVMLFSFSMPAKAYDWVRPSNISAIGSTKLSMTAGQEKTLRVKMKPAYAEDDFLTWKIVSGNKVVKFTDNDRNDDSIELRALKAGTAKIRCQIAGKSKKKVTFTVQVKKASKKSPSISAKGPASITVGLHDDFDLEVSKNIRGIKPGQLKWTIKNKKIVGFEDPYETVGDEVEFIAKKTGRTAITCINTKTKDSVVFQVKVVRHL